MIWGTVERFNKYVIDLLNNLIFENKNNVRLKKQLKIFVKNISTGRSSSNKKRADWIAPPIKRVALSYESKLRNKTTRTFVYTRNNMPFLEDLSLRSILPQKILKT